MKKTAAALLLCLGLTGCSAMEDNAIHAGGDIETAASVSTVDSDRSFSVSESITESETTVESSISENITESETTSEIIISENITESDTTAESSISENITETELKISENQPESITLSTYSDVNVSDTFTEITLEDNTEIETTFSRVAPMDFTGNFYMYLEKYSSDPEFWNFYIECLDGEAPINAVREFRVEKLNNGEWMSVPPFVQDVILESSFMGIVVGKEPPTLSFSVSDSDFAEPLDSGQYRITVFDRNGVFNGENVSCEFNVT